LEIAMTKRDVPECPDCDSTDVGNTSAVSRRAFFRNVSAAGLAALAAPKLPATVAQAPAAAAPAAAAAIKPASPAEDLVRELHAGMSNEQKRSAMYAWNHGATATAPAIRNRIYNAAQGRRVGQIYTENQQELIGRILRAMTADDQAFRRINTVINADTAEGLKGSGADIFGDPTGNRPFTFLFTAHHLTLRCDGNSEPDTAFGGPLYYGHSLSGLNERNAFNFQTRAVRTLYDALSEEQKRQSRVVGSPGEQLASIQFRRPGQARPGLAAADLSPDTRRLVEQTMMSILAPFRREDAAEVMYLLGKSGGLERLNLAFYQDRPDDPDHWHFWRIEGPGFVWNYRILPHVHCYVNIAARA
jgi:hypothetical protein